MKSSKKVFIQVMVCSGTGEPISRDENDCLITFNSYEEAKKDMDTFIQELMDDAIDFDIEDYEIAECLLINETLLLATWRGDKYEMYLSDMDWKLSSAKYFCITHRQVLLFPELPNNTYFLGGYQDEADKGKATYFTFDNGTCLIPIVDIKTNKQVCLSANAGKQIKEGKLINA